MERRYLLPLLITWFGLCGSIVCGSQINTYDVVKPEYYDMFFGKKERIYLTGLWDIAIKGQIGYYNPLDLKTIKQKKILVPNFLDSRGQPKYSNSFLNLKKKSPMPRWTLSRYFQVQKQKNKRYILKFEGVSWNPEVQINDAKPVELTTLAPGKITEFFALDITDQVKNGTNKIAVSLDVAPIQQRFKGSGIYNPVYIEVENPVYASELLISTKLPDRFLARVKVVNSTSKRLVMPLQVIIAPWKGAGTVTTIDVGRKVLLPGVNQVTLQGRIKNCQWWDVNEPFLYRLELKTPQFRIGLERFGVREFTIRGNEFFLNGHNIKCYGVAAGEGNLPRVMGTENLNPQFLNNGGQLLKKWLLNMKAAQVNAIIRYPQYTRSIYSLSDEIGILNFQTIGFWKPQVNQIPKNLELKLLKNPSLPDRYSRGFFYVGKKVMPVDNWNIPARNEYMRQIFRKVGLAACNSPSVVAILSGDENAREPNQAFDFPVQRAALHETAPHLLFAGEHCISPDSNTLTGKRKMVKPHIQQDFENFAGLACGGAAGSYIHYTMFPQTLQWCAENWVRADYGKMIPIYADEALWYGETRTLTNPGLWRANLRSYRGMGYGKNLNREKMVEILGRIDLLEAYRQGNFRDINRFISKTPNYFKIWWPFLKTLKCIGLQDNYLDKNVIIRQIADINKRNVEMVRMYDQYMQGVGGTTGPFMVYDSEKLSRLEFGGIGGLTALGKEFQRSFAPIYVCLNFYEKYNNAIAGDILSLKLYGFNYTKERLADVSVQIKFAGRQQTEKIPLASKVKVCKNIEIKVPGSLPSGNYPVTVQMFDRGKLLAQNAYDIFVLSRHDAVPAPLKKKIVVLGNRNSAFGALLAKWQIKADYVNQVPTYHPQMRLIVAPDVLSGSNKALENYLHSGGRALVLEQNPARRPQIGSYAIVNLMCKVSGRIVDRAIGIDLMIVDSQHPAFKKINIRSNWHTLNNYQGEVYHSLIGPLDTNAVAIGADVGHGETSRLFGTLLLEKDGLIWSQVEAVKAATLRDGVATRYLLNLLEYLQK